MSRINEQELRALGMSLPNIAAFRAIEANAVGVYTIDELASMVLGMQDQTHTIKKLESRMKGLELFILSLPDYGPDIVRMKQKINELSTMVY